MYAYLLENQTNTFDKSLKQQLEGEGLNLEEIELPEQHDGIHELFHAKEPGTIFIPAIWEDLFCVKVVNEIQMMSIPFETVIVGTAPESKHLIVAFNDGLGAYLQTPIDEVKCKTVVRRMKERLRNQFHQITIEKRLEEYEGGGTASHLFSSQVVERDHYLAHAFMDILKQKGPLAEEIVNVLVVTTSTVQQKRLEQFLKQIGITVKNAGNLVQGLKLAQAEEFSVIITDNVLPDGDAVSFVNQLRKLLTNAMPRFIVWTSSPEKSGELLKPENHIDDVILKPGPGAGIEAILPTLIAGIYQSYR